MTLDSIKKAIEAGEIPQQFNGHSTGKKWKGTYKTGAYLHNLAIDLSKMTFNLYVSHVLGDHYLANRRDKSLSNRTTGPLQGFLQQL